MMGVRGVTQGGSGVIGHPYAGVSGLAIFVVSKSHHCGKPWSRLAHSSSALRSCGLEDKSKCECTHTLQLPGAGLQPKQVNSAGEGMQGDENALLYFS
jgi:hypothetical protein